MTKFSTKKLLETSPKSPKREGFITKEIYSLLADPRWIRFGQRETRAGNFSNGFENVRNMFPDFVIIKGSASWAGKDLPLTKSYLHQKCGFSEFIDSIFLVVV